jgi:hypothetical protein
MAPFGLPPLPKLNESPIKGIGDLAKKGIQDIKQFATDIEDGIGNIDRELTQIAREAPVAKTVKQGSEPEAFVSDDSTYRFQLDLLIDNATDLETVHLPNKGRINGQSCDCIAKHARVLRAHAKETIPIASRQGKNSHIFAEIAEFADKLMLIGTKEAVESGQYDEEYLEYAGVMSRYRKKLEEILGQAHTSYTEECKNCPTTLSLKAFAEQRKAAVGKKNTGAVEEAAVNTET